MPLSDIRSNEPIRSRLSPQLSANAKCRLVRRTRISAISRTIHRSRGAKLTTLVSWANAGAPAGNPENAPPARSWPQGWMIPQPDVVVQMPKPVALPPQGDIDYTYEIVPTGFTEDKWVQMSEISPRAARTSITRSFMFAFRAPTGCATRQSDVPFTGADMSDAQDREDTHFTTSRHLARLRAGKFTRQLARGNGQIRERLGPGFSNALHGAWQTRPRSEQHRHHFREATGAEARPHSAIAQRPLRNSPRRGRLPRGSPRFAAEQRGATQLFPHMHLRGKRFEYNILHPDGSVEPLLRVHYNFYWQLSYRLAEPRPLQAGTVLQAVAWYEETTQKIIRTIPIQTLPSAGAIKPTMK